jgi:hypothetical protein
MNPLEKASPKTQTVLMPKVLTTYDKPQINYIHGNVQRIELHRGCPWQHEYCYEPNIDVNFPIPQLTKNHVQIIDMNLLARKDILQVLRGLEIARFKDKVIYYEAICGFDFRFLTQEIAEALKKTRFVRPRLAWDGPLKDQYKLKDALGKLVKAGYKPKETMFFMIVNWKILYEECLQKLDIMKVWNVMVCDCCYDGGYKYATPLLWKGKELKAFRSKCRKHNQLINFGLDPEVKP